MHSWECRLKGTTLEEVEQRGKLMKKNRRLRTMPEKMLVTQALDERDLLVKKISDKISRIQAVDTKKRNEEKTIKANDDESYICDFNA